MSRTIFFGARPLGQVRGGHRFGINTHVDHADTIGRQRQRLSGFRAGRLNGHRGIRVAGRRTSFTCEKTNAESDQKYGDRNCDFYQERRTSIFHTRQYLIRSNDMPKQKR